MMGEGKQVFMCPCSPGSCSGSVSVTDGKETMPDSFNQDILLFYGCFWKRSFSPHRHGKQGFIQPQGNAILCLRGSAFMVQAEALVL